MSLLTRLRPRALLTIGLLAATLRAQDAGQALSTLVGYRTLRASATLSDAQKQEADRLSAEAQAASAKGQYAEALRHMYHGTAVMRGVEWTPAVELASGLRPTVEHVMLEPGQSASLVLQPIYVVTPAPEGKWTVNVAIRPVSAPAGSEAKPLAETSLTPASLPFRHEVKLADLPAGTYLLEARLIPAAGAPTIAPGTPNPFLKTVPVHIEALRSEVEQLEKRLAALKPAQTDAALPTAQYALALYRSADRGDVDIRRYRIRAELQRAAAITAAMEKGANPLAADRGDVKRAYRSPVDQSLQPYRVYIPAAYDGKKPIPLVVALHGMGGDENSFFDSYDNGALKRQAEQRGMLVVCPKGREPASMYRGPAERDVMDVLAEVRRDFVIDANRVYLMGHSMGAYGTWSVAMNHPEPWAALGPISGGGNPTLLAKIKNLPEYVVHGDADKTVAVTQSRTMVEAAKKLGMTVEYVEVPNGSHSDVVVPQFGPMLDFFLQHPKSTAQTPSSL